MKNVIKKIAILTMFSCIAGNTSLLMSDVNIGYMDEPSPDKNPTSVNIKVINIPSFSFIAAGIKININSEKNYKRQTPISVSDGIYTFYSNHSYAVAKNISFMNQHKGTDFIGKTKWDVATDTIS